MRTSTTIFVAAVAALALAGEASAVSKSEIKRAKAMHVQIVQTMGVYEDYALQQYVQQLGETLARASELPDLEWTFTVVDTDDVNAFTTGGGFVYISRGILPYLDSEAELAAVLGHEIGHVTAEHPAERQKQSAMSGILGAAATIFTGQPALGQLTNMAGSAIVSGYGRDGELEADKLGAKYLARTGYDPQAMIDVVAVLKNQDLFERDRARAEGREPRIYHGVFSSHPDNDTRLREAVASAGTVQGLATGAADHRERYLKAIDRLAVGSSRRMGMVRDGRFYHADFLFTMAFPSGWVVQNEPQQVLSHSPDKSHYLILTAQPPPQGVTSPRDFALRGLANKRLDRGEDLQINGLDAYTVIVRGDGSPFGSTANVRWVIIYYNNLMWMIRGASRSDDPMPRGDPLFMSSARTFRQLQSSEFRLAQPHQLRVVRAPEGLTVEDMAARSPLPKYATEQYRLFNDLYPDRNPEPGALIKVVQ